ncbi:hypothetical protein COU20_03985 [Candidatus Kaiserbacteria bacterium CG10_big_fil_rev_8_21_14_0_10_59_10]|uniref:Hemolysin III n=1 Tax=Candidatus Kaiserbacteria bacterium CG10_big_fil_rev_8_21_14_0_10_59_10 TaxID=1974612 RepID=A0A2H0U6U8_9BACT|nr:MAG: hypothetical protein COU20_03985 [Candidatus Kaiserbacteria bacterium CG10_big_fil_rev_8_21_14_0_10_59_10]
MYVLRHEETGRRLRPRRPLVCALDITGMAIALVLLAAYRPSATVAVLPLAVIAMYAASCAYHWLPESSMLGKLDHMLIFVLIGVTLVPYWGMLLPWSEAWWRFALVAFAIACGCAIKAFTVLQRGASAAAYVAAAVPLLTSAHQTAVWLPIAPLVCFWAGVGLYLLQLAVYTARRPDPYPELFGYREVQHSILLCATTLHVSVALAYVR